MPNDINAMSVEAKRIEKDSVAQAIKYELSASFERFFNFVIIALAFAAAICAFFHLTEWEIILSIAILLMSAINAVYYYPNFGKEQIEAAKSYRGLADNARDFYGVRVVGALPSEELDTVYRKLRDLQQKLLHEKSEIAAPLSWFAEARTAKMWGEKRNAGTIAAVITLIVLVAVAVALTFTDLSSFVFNIILLVVAFLIVIVENVISGRSARNVLVVLGALLLVFGVVHNVIERNESEEAARVQKGQAERMDKQLNSIRSRSDEAGGEMAIIFHGGAAASSGQRSDGILVSWKDPSSNPQTRDLPRSAFVEYVLEIYPARDATPGTPGFRSKTISDIGTLEFLDTTAPVDGTSVYYRVFFVWEPPGGKREMRLMHDDEKLPGFRRK
jgi:hypothetical protein